MCFVFIWEQTAACATYSINWLVFITEMKSVYSAVRTGSLNKACLRFVCKGLRKSFLSDAAFGKQRTTALMWTFVVRCRNGFVRRNDRAARQMKEKANSCELYRTSSNDHTEAQDMTKLVPLHHERTFTPHVCMWRDASRLLAVFITPKFDCIFLIPPCVWVKFDKGKGKAIPLQAWTGPEGSRRLRLPDFKTVGTWRW